MKHLKILLIIINVVVLFSISLQADYECIESQNLNIIKLLNNGPEISIAISPVYPHNIVLVATNYVDENETFDHVLYSEDYGENWDTITAGMMPDEVVIGTHWLDPAVAIDLNNRFYVCYMDVANPQSNGYNLYINYSDDKGATWTTRKFASSADKEHIWVDNGTSSPYAGNLYAAWTSTENATYPHRIIFTRSVDGGDNWDPIQVITNEEHFRPFGVNIKTGPNGEVYLVWFQHNLYGEFPNYYYCGKTIWMAKSTDGGQTFDSPTKVIDNLKGVSCENNLGTGWPRLRSSPCLAVNPINGKLFLVWANHGVPGENEGDADIYMVSSCDGGDNWSPPIRVNPDDNNHQFFPWISIDTTSRWLHSVYYEWSGSFEDAADVYVSTSFDNGFHWTKCRVNTDDYGLNMNDLPYFTFDYIGIISYNELVIPAWNSRSSLAPANVTPFTIDNDNCCEGMRGDANNDGFTNVGDAVFLSQYVDNGGPKPFCFEEGDVDGSGEIDMADVYYMIAYVFQGGPPPVDCPQ